MSALIHPIAVIGAGPAAVFATDALLKHPATRVDVFERLLAPFGLVRYGVAPDHQKIKQVEAGFVKTLSDPRVRYFGNVTLGQSIQVAELLGLYDQIVFAMGCQAPQLLGIKGEEAPGVHSALEVVSWYNGHPDYLQAPVDLAIEQAVIVGAGDVSIDLCRLLLSTEAELAATDMPTYALSEFAKKRISHVHILIRRGPESAHFALKELRVILDRENVQVHADTALLQQSIDDVELAPTQRAKLVYLLQAVEQGKARAGQAGLAHLHFHFLRSPVQFEAEAGRLVRVQIEHNTLQRTATGDTRARGTGQFETLDVQFAALATGYRGHAVPGVTLDEATGLIPNRLGQVLGPDGPEPQQFVVGWLKRGPQGVIGTNKPDARETVEQMLSLLPPTGKMLPPTAQLLHDRGVRFINFEQWLELDRLERARGATRGKPRDKWLHVDEALGVLRTADSPPVRAVQEP